MKILHIVPTYWPAFRYGGPIHSVHGLCKALVLAGHDVTVCTTNVDGEQVLDVSTDQIVDVDGVKVRYFPVNQAERGWSRRLYHSSAMASYLRQATSDFDLLHLHSVFLWPTWFAAKQARSQQVPYIWSPRGMLVDQLIRRQRRWLKLAWIRGMEIGNFRHVAAMHFTSEQEQRDAELRLPALQNGFVLANGVDLALERDITVADRADDEILYLGRISWKKGLDRLIKALAQCPAKRLTVAGNDDENISPALLALAGEYGVSERVDFVGFVDQKQKQNLLRRVSILALCSDNENFGNVVLEAMAAACPVLVTDTVGASSLVKEHQAGEVVPVDVDEIVSGLHRLFDNPQRREQFGANGKHLVESAFSWQQIAQKMEVYYRIHYQNSVV